MKWPKLFSAVDDALLKGLKTDTWQPARPPDEPFFDIKALDAWRNTQQLLKAAAQNEQWYRLTSEERKQILLTSTDDERVRLLQELMSKARHTNDVPVVEFTEPIPRRRRKIDLDDDEED